MQGVPKTSTFNVLNNSSQILTNFNDFFECEILRKFDTKILQIVHLACHYTSGNPKKSFSIEDYSYILLIIYVISQENNL